jgi:formamidopyrimidine-DNA glycosylase
MNNIYESVVSTLIAMRDGGGRDTERDLFGNPGGYKTVLSSKTLMNPCPVCLGTLVKQAYLGGSIYFCPNCQPEHK